jgi:hypothetical protein
MTSLTKRFLSHLCDFLLFNILAQSLLKTSPLRLIQNPEQPDNFRSRYPHLPSNIASIYLKLNPPLLLAHHKPQLHDTTVPSQDPHQLFPLLNLLEHLRTLLPYKVPLDQVNLTFHTLAFPHHHSLLLGLLAIHKLALIEKLLVLS